MRKLFPYKINMKIPFLLCTFLLIVLIFSIGYVIFHRNERYRFEEIKGLNPSEISSKPKELFSRMTIEQLNDLSPEQKAAIKPLIYSY